MTFVVFFGGTQSVIRIGHSGSNLLGSERVILNVFFQLHLNEEEVSTKFDYYNEGARLSKLYHKLFYSKIYLYCLPVMFG